MKKLIQCFWSAALSITVLAGQFGAVIAEEPETGTLLDGELTTYTNNGYTFEKISHPKAGTEEPDGIVDYLGRLQIKENTNGSNEFADSVQSYTYCAASHGDWVYMGTMYGALSAYTQVESAVESFGASPEVAKAVVDVMFNGKLNKGREEDGIPAGSVFFKFNVKTGETKILMSRTLYNQGKCDGVPIFRSAAEYNGKLYFVGLVSDGKALAGQTLYGNAIPNDPALAINFEIMMQNGVPCVYEVDPENGDKLVKVAQCLSVDGYRALNDRYVFTSTRAIDTFTATKADGTTEEWLLAGGLGDITQGEAFGASILAAKNPSAVENDYNETDLDVLHGDFKVIADQHDLCDYPAVVRTDSEGGGGLYQVIQYGENTVYTAIVSGQAANGTKERAYAIVKGVYDPEKGEVNDAAAWTWTPVVGDQTQGAKYTFGIDPTRTAAGACTLETYGGYLYIGEYNDVNYSLTNILQNRSFRILAKNLSQSINLYRMDADENVELVVGDTTDMFPTNLTGIGSGYETHMTQYTWMTTVVGDTMYLSTMDETSLTHVVAQLVNGEMLNMSDEEMRSQINYIVVLLRLMGMPVDFPTPYALDEEAEAAPLTLTEEEAEVLVQMAMYGYNPAAMMMSLDDEEEPAAEAVEAVDLTEDQFKELVEGLVDGSIELGGLDEETAEKMEELSAKMQEVAAMLGEELSVKFVEAYDKVLGMVQESVKNSDKIPADVKGMLDMLFSFTVSENLGYVKTCLEYMKDSVAGFDLYAINQAEDGSVTVTTITDNGFNDRYNHGLRIFTTVPGYMVVGTANPFNGAQIWRTPIDNEEPIVTPEPEDPEEPVVDPEDPVIDPEDPKDPAADPETPEDKPTQKPSTGVDTGDSFNAGIFGGLMAACAGLAAAAWFALKKRA